MDYTLHCSSFVLGVEHRRKYLDQTLLESGREW
jgi:hypothetical protein